MTPRQLAARTDPSAAEWANTGHPQELDALPPPPTSQAPLTGGLEVPFRKLGEYELLEEVARGGMGVVYKARQRSLDRIVAVKMILDSVLPRPEDVARFQSEAAVAARLQHPNIVAIHEVGRHEGRHFFSMDYIEGPSLAEYTRQNPLTPLAAARLVRTISQAVQAAHDQGILHRDLKPSNVLIDAQEQPHVTDFGLAKRLEGDSQLTGTAQILGTPSYMPPEQARGEQGQVGFASDVYSLGAMLYETLTGRPPFRGDSPVATIRQVLETEPVSPRRLNPAVTVDLETICLKCLEKEPARRYPTAQALADELDRFARGVPIQARPIGPLARGWRWCRRNLSMSLALLLLLMLAVGGPAVAIYTSGLLRRATLAENDRLAAQIRSLRTAAPESVPAIVGELNSRREEVAPQLMALWNDASLPEKERTRLSLFLYHRGAPYSDHAYGRLLTASPQEFGMLRQLLTSHADPLVDALWREASAPERSRRVLHAAAALAAYDAKDQRWEALAPRVIDDLLQENTLNAAVWAQYFEPVKKQLIPALREAYCEGAIDRAPARMLATDLLASYAADDPQLLVELLSTADERQFISLYPTLAAHGGKAIELVESRLDQSLASKPVDWDDDTPERASANLAIALMRLGRAERLWPLLTHSPDPTLRTRLIHRLLPLGVSTEVVAARLATEQDVSSRRALLLSLGEAPASALSAGLREKLAARLADLYRLDPDTGIFAAAEWTLRKWGYEDLLRTIRQQTLRGDPSSSLGRFVTCEGQVMTVVRGPIDFEMGAPPEETSRFASGETLTKVRIARSFAFALHEVTREEYLRFENDPAIQEERKGQNIWHNENWSGTYGPDPQCPHIALPWMVAARYCRWLSERERIPEVEICFPICKSTGESMLLPENYLDRTGYRLPTAAEWEYMCRAGASTIRFFGRNAALLDDYAWHMPKSQQRSWPVGRLKPNDFGLFDIHGNVRELCFNRMGFRPRAGASGIALDEEESNLLMRPLDDIQTCGGSYNESPRFMRASSRETTHHAETGNNLNGMRLVRTIRPSQ